MNRRGLCRGWTWLSKARTYDDTGQDGTSPVTRTLAGLVTEAVYIVTVAVHIVTVGVHNVAVAVHIVMVAVHIVTVGPPH